MPTLIRLVFVLGGLAALGYGILLYLATQVTIPPHQITETVDLPKADSPKLDLPKAAK